MSRAKDRTVFIYNAQGNKEQLGGLVNNEGITNKNFHDMLEIILVLRSPYTLVLEGGDIVPKDDDQLQNGKYYVDGDFVVTDETALLRTPSIATASRDCAFTTAVRHRDGQCVVTGRSWMDWTGLDAAHIFPLAYGSYWDLNEFGRWITDGSGSINSVQNGILLASTQHKHFDMYLFSINPDDNHKIVYFQKDADGISGKRLGREFLDNPDRCSDQLLRWHYRQAVLMNLIGDGEIVLEHDFPPGSDMISQIFDEPRAAERMEFELFGRLSAYT